MLDRLGTMEIFVRVIDSASFSAAARALGTSQSRVSKAISALEKRLGARLVMRTTRHLSLTGAGAEYYRQSRAILAAFEEAEAAVRAGQQTIRGRLRVNTSALLALPLVQPALLAFRAEHPGVDIDLTMEDRRIDPVAEGVDLIVRVGLLRDSELVARLAGRAAFGFYASPGYLAANPSPVERLSDLNRHQVVGLPERQMRGNLVGSGEADAIMPQRAVTVSSLILARDAALAGAGIAALPRFLADPEVAGGKLIELLASTKLPTAEINFLHPFGQNAPRKVAAFMDFAVDRWRTAGALS